jgi:1-acyl-sn-glycerol-3-phosphate acyltransferase
MRTIFVFLSLGLFTPLCGGIVLLCSILGIPDRPGGVYELMPRWWARMALLAGGTKVVLHGLDRLPKGAPHIFIANHVSWFDVLALAAVLPRYKFVAKAELLRIPLFGAAGAKAAMIPIERENRKSAFESYRVAGERMREGNSVIVFPEGTRGTSYALRPFKKGPFVLAVAAQAPIVPTLIHGTIEVLPRGAFRVRAGTVDIHLLEPIPTEGMTYEDRNALADKTWRRLAEEQRTRYGVDSGAPPRLARSA